MQKSQYKFLFIIFPLFVAIVFLPLIPPQVTVAQSQQEEPDFIVTLALMAVADDRLDGVLDKSDLANIRDLVNEYYEMLEYKKSDYLDGDSRTTINQEKTMILSALDRKINHDSINQNFAIANYILGVTDIYEADGKPKKNIDESMLSDLVFAGLSGKFKPDQKLVDLLNQKLAEDEKNNVEKGLDGYTANTIERGDDLVDTAYDFSAGLSEEAFLDQLRQTKPLVFINNGGRDVQVMVEYYAPPEGLAISTPGLNLTVAKERSVFAAGFPQGNYVFCADWLTDMDTDGDGFKDYDKMVTHIWLSSAHSDDPDLAEEVYVNSVYTATPLGRCGGFKGEALATETLMTQLIMTEDNPQQWMAAAQPEEESPGEDYVQEGESEESEDSSEADFWDQDDDTPENEEVPSETETPDTGLTTFELANQGEHYYEMTCVNEGFTNTRSFTTTWEFTEDGVIGGGDSFYAWISTNTYQNDYPTIITFTITGYLANSFYTETNTQGQTTTSETVCVATIID